MVKCRLQLMYTRTTIQNVVHRPEALTSSGSLLEMQNLPRGVEWGGRWEGGSRERGHVYTYGWFMIKKPTQSYKGKILQLKINNLFKNAESQAHPRPTLKFEKHCTRGNM